MNQTFFYIFHSIFGACTGGIISMIVCRMMIKSNEKVFLEKRLIRICEEFNSYDEKITQAFVPRGEETASGIQHKDLLNYDKNKIIFLLGEIDNLSKRNKPYEEAFFTLNRHLLYKLLHVESIINDLLLEQDENDVLEVTVKKLASNTIYRAAQSTILKYK